MSDGGEDSPPPRPRRKVKKIIVASSSSGSESDDSGPAASTRKKRLRVLSDEDSDSSVSSLELGSRRKRTLPKLRDSDGDSDTSGWATDHSDVPKETQASVRLSTSQTSKLAAGFASDSSEGNSDKCSICLMRFTNQQVGTPQSCEHIFCLDCITEWSRNVNTCPVDRMTFDFIVVRACLGGRVLCTQPVQVLERVPSMEMLVVEDPTSCEICGSASSEDTMLLCDGCDLGFHMECLTPPMTQIPINQWLCPSCDDRFDVFDVVQMSDEMFSDVSEERPSTSSRTTHSRSHREPRRSSLEEPSTSARATENFNMELPSTSRGMPRSSRVSSSRRSNTTVRRTHRRKNKRRSTRTVIIEYKMDGNGKFPVTKRVKRRVKKRKTKKRQPRTAARRTQVRESVRAKLATLRAERGAGAAGADAAPSLALRRSRAGIPALSLFGSARDLDYFSDDDERGASGFSAAVAARPAAASFGAYRQARRKMVAVPSTHASSAPDILSSILESQSLLHSRRSTVSVTADGDVDIKLEPRRRRHAPEREGRLDLSQGADGAARKAPSYPGQPRGSGGWGGGYRYPREQAPAGPGPGAWDNGYGGHRGRGRGSHHHHGGDGDAFESYDNRRPHQYSQNEDAHFDRNRRRTYEPNRGPAEHNGRRGDERGRHSAGPTWQAYGARHAAAPPRPSLAALDNPLDMRVGHAPPAPAPAAPATAPAATHPDKPPAPAPRYGPLPEPPAFRFDAAPDTAPDAEEDERSDPDLVIDTEKYDPTEPTDDDEGGAPPTLPPPPAFPAPAPLASVENILAGFDASAINVSAGVLDSAVRHVLQQHRGLLGSPAPRADTSDADSDGDCPNFSIYSATSVHIASDASAGARAGASPPPAPEDGLEDLVQGDGDASPALSDEPAPPPAPAPAPTPPPSDYEASVKRKSDEYNEKVSKRCPITTNTRNPIKIKLNTPSLIRRQVSLYDEEDVEMTAEPGTAAAEPEAATEPEAAAESETAPSVSPEAAPRVSLEAAPRASYDRVPKSASPPPPAASESAEDEERSPEPVADGDPDTEPSSEREREDSERGGTPSIPDASPPAGASPRRAAASEKMTESISETEDERSYTPCLDENRERDETGERERGIEGLDTEMISEDEGNEMFSDERSASPAASTAAEPAPAVAAAVAASSSSSAPPPANDDPKKKKKKDSKREGRERKTKIKRAEVAFKKAGKAAKERNYRERDKEERADKRERRDSGDSERARRRKDKRKDLERYDVRTLVSERRRRTKDAFGRDVSPRASPSPSPARSATPPRAAEAAASPRRRRRRSASRSKRVSARRRRSGSRARKRRRSASGSPKPKTKKKKRARSERPRSRSRSARRKSPKRKRVRRRSGSRPAAAAAAPAPAWSPRPESRPASPRTPPPAPAPPAPEEPRRVRKRRDRSKHRRMDGPGPSKEVFTSGDNILVSVSFKEQEQAEGPSRRERRRERRRRRRRAAAADAGPKPVAIIDLERSPFRELTPSPKNVIVLSDDEQREPPPEPPAPEPAGPKTPPEPAAAPPAPAAAPDEPRGPNTPPEPPDSPDAYDPYEPTRSASASPSPPAAASPSPARPSMTLEAAQKTNMSADEVLDRRPLSPIEKVMALLQSTRDVSPEPPPAAAASPPAPAAPAPAPAPRVVLPSPTRAAPPKLFLAKPSPIKSDPIKPMQQATKISRLPLPRGGGGGGGGGGGDSPYSPGSSDFGDLFEPPAAGAARRDSFDALFDKAPRGKKRAASAKVPVKLNKKKGKTQVDVKIDDDNLKILDDLPSSAVEMQVKSKFLKKLNRQERVVEEVKLVLKPHYNKKHVSKEEYKHILRRAVPKICHNKTGEINPTKIQALVEAYVKKFRKKRKLALS